VGQSDSTLTSKYHSPKKATLLSVALPGAGQIYNKKYWKLPIVYGGLGLSIYYLNRNLDLIKLYRGDLIALENGTPTQTNFSASNLNLLLNQYKNLRDWSYISIGAIYALQILDANVDAHLFNFDVDEDLSMTILPYMDMTAGPVKGIHLAFNF
jgi:hypothetical protein